MSIIANSKQGIIVVEKGYWRVRFEFRNLIPSIEITIGVSSANRLGSKTYSTSYCTLTNLELNWIVNGGTIEGAIDKVHEMVIHTLLDHVLDIDTPDANVNATLRFHNHVIRFWDNSVFIWNDADKELEERVSSLHKEIYDYALYKVLDGISPLATPAKDLANRLDGLLQLINAN
jgi:hypothetical protein